MFVCYSLTLCLSNVTATALAENPCVQDFTLIKKTSLNRLKWDTYQKINDPPSTISIYL